MNSRSIPAPGSRSRAEREGVRTAAGSAPGGSALIASGARTGICALIAALGRYTLTPARFHWRSSVRYSALSARSTNGLMS